MPHQRAGLKSARQSPDESSDCHSCARCPKMSARSTTSRMPYIAVRSKPEPPFSMAAEENDLFWIKAFDNGSCFYGLDRGAVDMGFNGDSGTQVSATSCWACWVEPRNGTLNYIDFAALQSTPHHIEYRPKPDCVEHQVIAVAVNMEGCRRALHLPTTVDAVHCDLFAHKSCSPLPLILYGKVRCDRCEKTFFGGRTKAVSELS